MRTPSDLRRRRIDTAREKSSIRTPSVISSSSRPASNPVSIRVSWTSRTMSSLRNCTGDKLTEICSWFGPGCGFAARGSQDPFTHRDDQPVLFREWNEDSRCDHAAARMVPADQRFETHDLAVDPRQWLKIEPQLVVGESRLQIVLQFASIAQLRGHVGLEEPDRIAPFGLGAVERHIRVGEQGRRVGPINRTRRDADAQSNAKLSSGELDVTAQ